MNIQPTSYTKNHLITNNGMNVHMSAADELSLKKRREDLSRRPSYRKIFNDITGLSGPEAVSLPAPPPALVMGALPPPGPGRQSTTPPGAMAAPGAVQQQPPQANNSPSPQSLDLLSSVAGIGAAQGDSIGAGTNQSPVSVVDIQTANVGQNHLSAASQQQLQTHSNQATHHPHLHHQHPSLSQHSHQQHPHHQQQAPQQHHLTPTPPSNHLQQHATNANIQQRLQPPPQQQHLDHQQQQQQNQSPHHHHMHHLQSSGGATSPPNVGFTLIGGGGGGGGGGVGTEEASKKRELRLQKNREAAKECRRKKKEYIKCLENRVAVLENQNKALIDELKTLKDLYCKSTTE